MDKIHYDVEREGQLAFFDKFKIPYEDDDSILVDNTDGVVNGNILEFKLNINDLNRVLFQAVKYLSHMRIKGESVPATILLIDLNNTLVYAYHSIDYKADIQKVYNGSASKDNTGFVNDKSPFAKYDYSKDVDTNKVKHLLTDTKTIQETYIPIDIDENCIVGWAERYYRELPEASKGDFLGDETGTSVKIIGEIRKPIHFEDLINPYTGKTNEKFKYLMDCLNDRLSKKDLGAFYTPSPYAEKAAELVQMAVEKVPTGNDYIILDRCAGTGNLEEALTGRTDRNNDELISHCVVSTYEYYEYKVLQERIGDKVRDIIPPTEANVEYASGKVANADAMTEEYINNPSIKQYIDNKKCTVILLENPPYNDRTSGMKNGQAIRTGKKKSFVGDEMSKQVSGVANNDMANLFIWSGFRYYMRQKEDCYIVFSPIKYWKNYHLVDKKFCDGFLFNRTYFHATASGISCILWQNQPASNPSITLHIWDIIDSHAQYIKDLTVYPVYNVMSKLYTHTNKKKFMNISTCCAKDGTENVANKVRVKSYYSDDMIGYLEADAYTIGPEVRNLTRLCLYNGNGCYLTRKNYLKELPLFVAKYIPLDAWYQKGVYATTSDGGTAYADDASFLQSCLIYTCLSNQNKCLTFDGSDGRHYQNELCFDNDTVASKDLKCFSLDLEEKDLINLWQHILNEARGIDNSKGYAKPNTLGVYQITKEIDTHHKEGKGKDAKIVYDHPELHGDLNTLKAKLKDYYNSHITEKMFKYELVK